MKLVFDFHRGSLPDDLMNLFNLTTDVQATNLVLSSTENNLLYIPRFVTTTYGKKLIRYQCPKVWNHTFKNGTLQIELDRQKDIKLDSIETVNQFKKSLKRHYLYTYSQID